MVSVVQLGGFGLDHCWYIRGRDALLSGFIGLSLRFCDLVTGNQLESDAVSLHGRVTKFSEEEKKLSYDIVR